MPVSKLEVGQPLPCDAYDVRGTLLLREGQVLRTEAQLSRITEETLAAQPRRDPLPDTRVALSPLGAIMAVRRRLTMVYQDPTDAVTSEIPQMVSLLRRACAANPDLALASILMQRDGLYAVRHAVNVAIACELTSLAMDLPAATRDGLIAAALTMNIAMWELQEALLGVDGPLDEDQHAAVHDHCEQAVVLLRDCGVTDECWLDAVRDHHERPDGSGYPKGKRGDEIAAGSRLLLLADIYCARISERQYRAPLQPNIALRWLFLNEGATLDERLAALLIRTLGVYPPGTGVRLRNSSIAVVTHRGTSGIHPKVASLTTNEGLRMASPIRRRGDVEAHAISEVVDLEAHGLDVSMEALWGADAAL